MIVRLQSNVIFIKKNLKVLAPIVLPKYLNCICLFVGNYPASIPTSI